MPEECIRCEEWRLTQNQPGYTTVKSYLYTPAECYDAQPVFIDVNHGYEIAKQQWAAGRPIYYFEPDEITLIQRGHEINQAHVDHVPLEEPGLVAMFEFRRRDTGVLELVNHLIDGNHRAARQAKHGRRFFHYGLTVEETASVSFTSCEEIFARYVSQAEAGV